MNEHPTVPGAQDLYEVVDLVTSTLLDLHSEAIGPPDQASRPLGDPVWTGCIGVTGPFSGAITIACARGFVDRALATMLEEESSDDAARDVLAEITNVIGGNIKSLLGSAKVSCQLALPIVSVGALDMPAATLLQEQWCTCAGDTIVVSLWKADDGHPTRFAR